MIDYERDADKDREEDRDEDCLILVPFSLAPVLLLRRLFPDVAGAGRDRRQLFRAGW